MSPAERGALKLAASEARTLRPDHFSSMDRTALDAATRVQRLIDTDPARQAARMMRDLAPRRPWEDSIMSEQRRHMEDKVRLCAAIDPSAKLMDEKQLLFQSLGIPSRIEREPYLPPVRSALPDIMPKRDYQLEVLSDIQRSLKSAAKHQAENVQASVLARGGVAILATAG